MIRFRSGYVAIRLCVSNLFCSYTGDIWDIVRSPGSPFEAGGAYPQTNNGRPFATYDRSYFACNSAHGNSAWWYNRCGSLHITAAPVPTIYIINIGSWNDLSDVHLMLKEK